MSERRNKLEWKHKCSLAWLKERQYYLTASEIKKLLPITATGRNRTVSDMDRIKVMSSKMVTLTEDDCWSYGAAARGHIMEPYAITTLNEILSDKGRIERFYWWDDALVKRQDRMIAFSPDAMNVPMANNFEAPSAIAEVKSYGAEKHLATAYTPKDKIEERWQIATAMALYESIDHGYLELFNPKMKLRKTFVIRFDKSDLEKEIEMILKVEEDWKKFIQSGLLTKRPVNEAIYSSRGGDEEHIIKLEEQKQRLNPVV